MEKTLIRLVVQQIMLLSVAGLCDPSLVMTGGTVSNPYVYPTEVASGTLITLNVNVDLALPLYGVYIFHSTPLLCPVTYLGFRATHPHQDNLDVSASYLTGTLLNTLYIQESAYTEDTYFEFDFSLGG